jgi:tetratricopeptide (TPR) repeat protein
VSTLRDLFRILDGWEAERSPSELAVNPEATISGAKRLIEREDYTEARRVLTEEIGRVRPALRFAQQGGLEVRGATEGAATFLSRYICQLHLLVARTLLPKMGWREARDHLLNGLALMPDEPSTVDLMVRVYLETERYKDALRLLERMLNGQEDRCLPLFQLALHVRMRGEPHAAATGFTRVGELDDIGLFRELANIQIGMLDAEPPQLEELEHVRQNGSSAVQSGDSETALKAFYEVLAWHPDNGPTWFGVGYVHQQLTTSQLNAFRGRPLAPIYFTVNPNRRVQLRRAAQAFRLAIVSAPDLVEAHHQLANCYLEMDLAARALRHAQHAANLASDDPGVLADLGNVLQANGALEEAEMALRASLSLDPNDEGAHLAIATILERTGRVEEAEEHWSRLGGFFEAVIEQGKQ